ncbi:peptidoglycan editing factor PgeF [Sulfurimonas paralvinellae]|uniref:Purine nucleoside phosphorylase n=1 Tax=Sulfurimonas paralvinellae TaxID=317658 RepID=A0A7M1B927_9BACT|nr:peptidoglycan editing factor PgeF [Sulfurimonas paralvinellae]QOP46210.1 peptidoglycan editing factor PgeF [Sulfurimonas paralvinellae]
MQFYQSKLLKKFPEITHAFTTKETGNLAFHVNDDPAHVLKNHQRLSRELNYKLEILVHMKQIHSNEVKIITDNDTFDNPPTCDALITDKKNTLLMVMTADCSPILFYDPVQKVIAVAHAGRAGAFTNIIKNVIRKFTNDFNSQTKEIVVAIGPAICGHCYEVDDTIYQEAKKRNLAYALTQESNKYYLNIRDILHKQLLEENILEKNIEISDICSRCDSHFYSYREEKNCGRFAGIIKLD